MNTLSNSKSILAKLLAEENISVQHKKIPTAYFDVKNRILACPIWADMSADLYDLLMGHEVGHALYTPAEGWHNAITENLKDKPGFKSYLNVIEDARIEKLIKGKFPGMRKPFYTAYGELFDKGFFGLTSENCVEDLPLIDRINLYYKVGPFVGVDFTEEEAPLVALVENAKTWNDVVAAAHKIYEYGKQEASKSKEYEYGLEGDDEGDLQEVEDSGDQPPDSSEEIDDLAEEIRDAVESITDKSFRARESELIDPSSAPIVYANLPQINLLNRIVPFKTVHEHMKFYEPAHSVSELQNLLNNDFKKKNEKYINYLVKEFELRKNARQFARAAESSTGELDMKKIHNYKLSENLFRKITVVPQGKSHGLLMFMDLSGSMEENMKPTIEQILILTSFCRKVNIPFNVYGFTDLPDTLDSLAPIKRDDPSFKEGDLNVFQAPSFRLREYLSSAMTGAQFTSAQKNMLYLAECFATTRNIHFNTRPVRPASEALHGTPLDEAIVASMQIHKVFKQAHKLDVVNIIFLTDGDGVNSTSFYTKTEFGVRPRQLSNQIREGYYSGGYSLVVTDQKTKLQGVSNPGSTSSDALLELLKVTTGANVIGFFLQDRNILRSIREYIVRAGMSYKITSDEAIAFYRKNGYFSLRARGYDEFYMLPGGRALEIGDETLKVSADASKGEIKRAFMKNLNQKSMNRVFLSRFAEIIS